MNSLLTRLSGITGGLRFQITAALLLWITLAGAVILPYSFNPGALIRFGHYYTHQNPDITPPGTVHFIGNEANGGNGYDGQIFYFYARTLLHYGNWPKGFQDAYRAPRVGYPLLAALPSRLTEIILTVSGVPESAVTAAASWVTAASLIFWQIALLLFSGILLHRMLPDNHKYLSFIYLISPFVIQSWVLLLSDTIMISLAVTGVYYFFRIYSQDELSSGSVSGNADLKNLFRAFSAFSLAVLTKESSLVLLFPLGIYAVMRKDWLRSALMVSVLFPMIAWQLYLRSVHGMVPAGVLSVFLSPFNGIIGFTAETLQRLSDLGDSSLRSAAVKDLIKGSARWILIFIILSGISVSVKALYRNGREWIQRLTQYFQKQFLSPSGSAERLNPAPAFALAALLNILTLIMADYYYFWSVYENVSRMLTILVPIVILLKISDEAAGIRAFTGSVLLLSFLVIVRTAFLTPRFPWDFF